MVNHVSSTKVAGGIVAVARGAFPHRLLCAGKCLVVPSIQSPPRKRNCSPLLGTLNVSGSNLHGKWSRFTERSETIRPTRLARFISTLESLLATGRIRKIFWSKSGSENETEGQSLSNFVGIGLKNSSGSCSARSVF